LHTRTVPANAVRIPDLEPGEVVVVERYGKPYAAIIDEASFELFRRMLAMFGEHQPAELRLSDTALAVHASSEAGEDVEEFDYALLDSPAR